MFNYLTIILAIGEKEFRLYLSLIIIRNKLHLSMYY